MDGDLLLYIKDDHICICATNFSEGSILKYFQNLFETAKFPKESTQLDIQKIADVQKLALINSQGVKEIEIKAALYKASLRYSSRKRASGFVSAVKKHIHRLIADAEQFDDNLVANIVLKTDQRIKKGGLLGSERLKTIAEDIIEDDDVEYNIITGAGQRISNTEIFVRDRVDIERLGKSVNEVDGWKKLAQFYGALVASGITEQ
jgi:hypothetical protein